MSLPAPKPEPEIEAELAAAIDPWLEHMRWRHDFAEWRQRRLWQEQKQESTLNNLRSFLRRTAKTNGSGNDKTGVDILAGKSILDLGCGMGGLATALALAGAQVHALDFNSQYCAITRLRGRRYGLDLPAVNAAGESLPFRSDQFDVVFCLDVLEHAREPENLFPEIQRCLKPGGIVYVTAINRFAFRDPHYHARFVNWLPRSWSASYLRITGRVKDNSRFVDRQTLTEMHYYQYGKFKQLFARHGLSEPCDISESKLGNPLSGWKGMLQRSGLLNVSYRMYRSCYKSTFVVTATKKFSGI